MGKVVGLGPAGVAMVAAAAVPGQKTAGQRAPGEQADPLVAAERDHLALLFPVDEVVVVLHRHEAGEAPPLGGVQHLRHLPGVHRRCADGQGLPGADNGVERLQDLLHRRRRVETVDLVEIDVVELQTPEARIDGVPDVLAR